MLLVPDHDVEHTHAVTSDRGSASAYVGNFGNSLCHSHLQNNRLSPNSIPSMLHTVSRKITLNGRSPWYH